MIPIKTIHTLNRPVNFYYIMSPRPQFLIRLHKGYISHIISALYGAGNACLTGPHTGIKLSQKPLGRSEREVMKGQRMTQPKMVGESPENGPGRSQLGQETLISSVDV